MANAELPTRGIGPTDALEIRSRLALHLKLPPSEALLVPYDGKHPNLDGHIEFFGPNGSRGSFAFFQLKATEQDVAWYDADVALLNCGYRFHGPVFLFLANVPQDKVFWVHVDRQYISSVLGIADLRKYDKQTKRIHFPSNQTIDSNLSALLEACQHHQNPADDVAAPAEPILPEEPVGSVKVAAPFEAVEVQFRKSSDVTEKMLLYYGFIHLLMPIYMDSRGDRKRRMVLTELGITDSEERFMIEKLLNAGFIGRAGDLLYVAHKQDALTILSHYMDSGRLDPEQLINRFSDDDEA